MFLEVNERNFPSLIKEEHYSIVKEPGGDYLFPFVPEMTNNKKKAEVIADHLIDWLNSNDQNLMALEHKCQYWLGRRSHAMSRKKIK